MTVKLPVATMMNSAYKLMRTLRDVQQLTGWAGLARFSASCVVRHKEILEAKSLGPADRGMGGRTWAFRVDGRRIVIDGDWFGGGREIFGRRVYTSRPGFTIKPGDMVIDLGANAGVFTMMAASCGAKVLAVEAQSGLVRQLQIHASMNGVTQRVLVEQAMVGGRSGVAAEGRLETASHAGKPPKAISMRELLDKHQIHQIDFLKIDIEGSEFDLLAHDSAWLAEVENIAMEVHLKYGSIRGLVRTLQKYGFEVVLTDNDQRCVTEIEEASGYVFAARPSKVD